MTKDSLLTLVRNGQPLTINQSVRLAFILGTPAMLSQVASVLLQFIDASMVGSMGAGPSASIGLVTTTIWIFGGFCSATSTGFSVQVAHLIGSNDFYGARKVVRQGLTSVLMFSLVLALIGIIMSNGLPVWLGGSEDIVPDSRKYFFIYACFIPFLQLNYFCSAILQCSGNMKVPSIMNVLMCVLDVIFNCLFIFPSRDIVIAGHTLYFPGAGMGVAGAALGTGVAVVISSISLLCFLVFRSKELSIIGERGSFRPSRNCLNNALGVSGPMWIQNILMRGAHVMSTIIVAPLGAVSLAANSLAITAESFCYMPGYGMADAATALVGQSLGANRKDLARRFAWIALSIGMSTMTALAVLMYISAPTVMSILNPDPEVIALGAKALKLEAFAEPMFAASIVAYGVCVGAGDTKIPSIINFVSMWLIRIAIALILTPKIGLMGYWWGMFIELNVRGVLFLLRIKRDRWLTARFIRSV